ncbi:MAG: transaldolase [Candidatus Omnitrophica bacterium]|nr:transaldolase [Candidatus Omnitrophota bacterium]
MSQSTIQQLADFGQSVWLDYISRPLLETGELKSLIEQGLRGMTSNPSIFENAIGKSDDYDQKIIALKEDGKDAFDIYDALSIKDIQDATDQFSQTYRETNKLDGYVSLEINPLLAHKVNEQVSEGVRLFKSVNRPNVMIKVPSTLEGVQVIEELTAQGINVNATLIFSLEQYEQVAKAYIKGLARLAQSRPDLRDVHSVASVFVSRTDTAIDKILDEKIAETHDENIKAQLNALKGKAAVANCHRVFALSKALFSGDSFTALQTKHANIQRVLWGSTSTKNPDYNDVKYVEELIVKPTVNTIPANTLKAFIDHGTVQEALQYDVAESEEIIKALRKHGIDIETINQKLLIDGCAAFSKAFESLLFTIEQKASALI